MDEESNPIKDYLFDYIKSSTTIPQLISEKKFDVVIDEIIQNCHDKICIMDEKDAAVGVLATGILHYLLTNALLNSQRKVEYRGMELDIVVPDVNTLEKDSKMSLVICIPKTSDKNAIEEKIIELQKVQPIKENIWLVLSEEIPLENKTFVLSKENSTLSKIIFEIAKFSNVNGANKFKILQI